MESSERSVLESILLELERQEIVPRIHVGIQRGRLVPSRMYLCGTIAT